jgi:hypothetical protein
MSGEMCIKNNFDDKDKDSNSKSIWLLHFVQSGISVALVKLDGT